MKLHLGLALASIVSIGALGGAMAADMAVKAPPPPPAPVMNWSGFYFGVNGGWGWGNTDHTDLFAVTTGQFRTSGGLIGGTYGANWQIGQFVIGVEGDFDYANINGTFTSATLCSISRGSTCFTNMRTSGRIGYGLAPT
jgi:outer membrane immunogenic protein